MPVLHQVPVVVHPSHGQESAGEGATEEGPDGQAGGGEGAGHAQVHPGKEAEEQVLADPVLVVETID